MNEFWYEEELTPPAKVYEETVKEWAATTKLGEAKVRHEIENIARGIVRTNRPRWQLLEGDQKPLRSGEEVRFYLVRLGFEFEISKEFYDRGARFTFGRCAAFLRADQNQQSHPIVYEVIPRNLFEGEQRKVSIKVGPNITVGDYGGSLGEISTDLMVGQVTPAVIGYTGQNECEPYWDLRPITKSLLGLQNLWLIIEVPKKCDAVRLAVRAEGDIQTMFGPVAVGPKEPHWENRPSIRIPGK